VIVNESFDFSGIVSLAGEEQKGLALFFCCERFRPFLSFVWWHLVDLSIDEDR